MLKLAKKHIYKEYFIVFFCLLIFGNLAHFKVLCFGADGHIELESAFHVRCDASIYSSSHKQNILIKKEFHEICKHCGPCIDVPIYKELIRISNTPQKLNQILLFQTINILTDIDKLNCSEYNFTKNTLFDTSYFDPLRSVILLV